MVANNRNLRTRAQAGFGRFPVPEGRQAAVVLAPCVTLAQSANVRIIRPPSLRPGAPDAQKRLSMSAAVTGRESGQVAQSVEQRTENPCVGGSIPPLATTNPQCHVACM